jgi:tetratricopeptide (TPR) repeat protein
MPAARTQAGIDALVEQARAHIEAGAPDKAMECLNRAIRRAPAQWWTWWRVGRFAVEIGLVEPGAQFLAKSVAIEPTAEALLDSGAALQRLGRPDLAAEGYAAAIATDGKSAAAWHGRGVSLFAIGQIPEALSCLDNAVTLAPDNVLYAHDLAESLRRVGRID